MRALAARNTTSETKGTEGEEGEVMSDELHDKRAQFTVEIECPKCGQKGHAIWERDAPNPQGLQPKLLSLPVGFSERVRTNLTELPEIVCDKCGTVQPD
jgi:DNA-directed RNA polymerase subunit RPC12/RpoP